MVQKLKVGLDLDGCVYNFIGPFDKFAKNKGYKINESKYSRGIDNSKLKRLLTEFSIKHPFLWIPKYKGAIEKLRDLSEVFEYHIVTFRNWYEFGDRETVYRLRMDNFNYEKIYFTNEKGKFAKNLDLDIFFEDTIENAKDILNKSNAQVFLIDHPYNQGFEHSRITRIKSIAELKSGD